jgi:acetate---CoA ligase (ADP-forming)
VQLSVPRVRSEIRQAQSPVSSLDRLLRPKSIALVGASESGLNGSLLGNLSRDYQGTIYPVNPHRETVLGLPCFPGVDALPEPADLVILSVPAQHVADIAEKSAEIGCGGALAVGAGFAEVGTEGGLWQQRLTNLGRNGFAVLGPNCNGFMNQHDSVMASFVITPSQERPRPGPVALISQSGGVGAYLITKSVAAGVQLGWYVSSGNECDVNVSRVLRYVIEDERTSVVLTFHEAVRDVEDFVAALDRAAELGKTVITLKGGLSEQGSRAALSHTASLVGSSAVYDAVCRQHGAIRASSFDEMIDYGLIFQAGRPMRSDGLGILTVSGGAGVIMADVADSVGLTVPQLPQETQDALNDFMPVPNYGSTANPIDTTGMITTLPDEYYGRLASGLADAPEIGGIAPVLFTGNKTAAIMQAYLATEKPVAVAVTAPEPMLVEAAVPTYPDPGRATRALGVLRARTKYLESGSTSHRYTPDVARRGAAQALVTQAGNAPFLLEDTAKKLFALYGIPVSTERRVQLSEDVGAAAQQVGFPVAVKLLSYSLPHKSDAGALRLNLNTPEDVRKECQAMVAAVTAARPDVVIEGVLVQQMVPADIELALGVQRDPDFGAVVAIGLGGTMIELGPAPELLRAPFDIGLALGAIGRLGGGALVGATRGITAETARRFATAAVRLGELALDLAHVTSVDINPLRATAEAIVAVDGLVAVATS